jgi:spermidine synthase
VPAVLLISVFAVATCGLVYELISGALASYLLGDSVTQFSTIIGAYLFSMGVGSYLARFVQRNLLAVFVQVEILIGLVGGFSAAALFILFEYAVPFQVALYGFVALTGVLVGLELPLLMRILQSHFEFKDLVSNVLTFDYVGALAASIIFPLVLVPRLGLVRSAFLFGMVNVAVAFWALVVFRLKGRWAMALRPAAAVAFTALLAGFVFSERLVSFAEEAAFGEKIVYSKSTPYQRIVLTSTGDDLRLYLNGNLQFSSRDEYRYHEALVHPGLASLAAPARVLVLGGGDGLALREILKYPTVTAATLVDLDPAMPALFSRQPFLTRLNAGAFADPRVEAVTADAFVWLKRNRAQYDFIVVDFPDPSNYSVGKLYSVSFYRELVRALAPGGRAVIQSTSPFVARKSFWCVVHTLEAAGLKAYPYHAYVPSFGEWGFVLATASDFTPPRAYPPGLRFVSLETAAAMFLFPPDMAAEPVEVNRLQNQVLVRYFDQEWSQYAH